MPGTKGEEERVYVAGPDGFTAAGLRWHNEVLVPQLKAAGLIVLDPWNGEEGAGFAAAEAETDAGLRSSKLAAVNERVGEANRLMIDDCDVVLANLEGSDVDSGTAAEIGYAAALGRPIFAFREDLRRTAENEAVSVNLQVQHFIVWSGGRICKTSADAIEALSLLE